MKKITYLFLLFYFCQASAQAVSGYSFSQSTESYQPVSGTNSLATGDDGVDNLIPMGFGFNFGGITYTTFSISTNGWIRLGDNVGNQSWVNTLANTNTQSPLIAAFWDDHNRTTGSIQYVITGTTPNRQLEIGWDNINIGNGGNVSATAFGSFKMRLYETSGIIEFVYGPTMNLGGALTASVGLNDTVSFLSVTPQNTSTVSSNVANNAIASTQFLTGRKFTFTPQPQCSGIPNPGNTVSSLASACLNVPVTVSLQNTTSDFGLSYQWESSVDGVNFTAIADATSPTYSTTQTATTSYQCIVSCGASSATSNPVQVLTSPASECYCFPFYNNGKTDGDLISNVIIAGTALSNNTGTAPVNPYYTYFSGQPNYTATLQSGYSYQMSVTVGTYDNQNDAVWIDYNDDAVFSPEERVGYSDVIGSNGTGIFTISLACDAPQGVHRMRIRDVWSQDASTIDPCATYGYGEVEDYDITIVAAIGCQMPFNLLTGIINSTNAELMWESSGCGQSSWDVHLTQQGGGLPVSEPSNPEVTSTFTATALSPSTAYDFYVRSNCGTNGFSDWAGPFTFTTLAPGVANDDCETATALETGATFEEHAIVATNVGATKTLGQPNPTCAIFGFGGDVWFSAVVPADGNITIEVQADPGSPLIDTGLSAFSGDCSNLTTIGCSDDEGVDAFSRLNLTGLTPGETIYARVWEYANDTFGTFQVSAWNPTLKSKDFSISSLKFYPNPVKDMLEISAKQSIKMVEIYNMIGQKVLNKLLQSDHGKVDMTTLSQGTYLVKVITDESAETIKVVKE